jgi:hypothetical protein
VPNRRQRKRKGKGPPLAANVQARAPQSSPDNEQGPPGVQAGSSAPASGQNGTNDRRVPANNGDETGGVRRKRRRKGQGKGHSSAADGQAQEVQDNSTPQAGRRMGEQSESLEGGSAMNGEAVDVTGKKKRRKRQNRVCPITHA